jgi:hypothetical protein
MRFLIGTHRPAGCRPYGTDAELAALNRVCEFLCPLVNYFRPNKKLLGKTRAGSKIIKTYDKELKTPCHRLLESALPQEVKDAPRRDTFCS